MLPKHLIVKYNNLLRFPKLPIHFSIFYFDKRAGMAGNLILSKHPKIGNHPFAGNLYRQGEGKGGPGTEGEGGCGFLINFLVNECVRQWDCLSV